MNGSETTILQNPRLLAARAVMRCTKENAYSNLVISLTLDQKQLSEADRGLYTALVYTTLENLLTIDYIILNYSARDRRHIDDNVMNTLRIGACQLFYMDKIPERAIVYEAVSLTADEAKRFVNGVLRAMCRDKENMFVRLADAPDSIKYSISEDIIDLVKEQYPDSYDAFCKASHARLPLAVRVNTLRITYDGLKRRMKGSVQSKLAPETGLIITEKLAQTATTRSCYYYVQGEPSQFAVSLLGVREGDTVVDVAACPGGKAIGAAIDMANRGRVIALDIHENKMDLLLKTARRLGVRIIETAVHDGKTPKPELLGIADRVICDVPCSALGLVGSKPEIRYKSASSFSKLPQIQYSILESACSYLKPGGVLVYSTCTVNKNENTGVIDRYMSEHDNMTVTYMKQFMTHTDATEGFFVCRMEKKTDA